MSARRMVSQKAISRSTSFRNNLSSASADGFRFRENKHFRTQFLRLHESFITFRRNIRRSDFVYIGAAAHSAVQGEIQKKPRGGSFFFFKRSFSRRYSPSYPSLHSAD